jgi:hypothetical protein
VAIDTYSDAPVPLVGDELVVAIADPAPELVNELRAP